MLEIIVNWWNGMNLISHYTATVIIWFIIFAILGWLYQKAGF